MDDGAQRRPQQPTCSAVQAEHVSPTDVVVHVVGGLCDEVTTHLRSSAVSTLTGSLEALVLDLSAVTEIDAGGVNVLQAAAAMTGERDIFFCLVLPPDSPVLAALADADSSALFEIFSSVTEALRRIPT